MNKTDPITFEEIRCKAFELGWDDVGVTEARIPTEDIAAYESWVEEGYHAKLAYMENTMRCDPQQLFPGAQSAIIFVTNYKQESTPFQEGSGLIASYARGRDYHHVHRKRLKHFIHWLEERSGQQGIAKGFSDSSPILEKALAAKAGLGWMGKNTLLIHRRFGTFTLLSGLLTTLDLHSTLIEAAPAPLPIHLPRCGTCTRCMDACPTQALVAPYQLDAARCLSYHLIESKDPIPPEIQSRNPGYVFGCDICQDACPHNKRKQTAVSTDFSPESGMGTYLSMEEIEQLEQHPQELFGTPLQRRGVQGLKHTADTLRKCQTIN